MLNNYMECSICLDTISIIKNKKLNCGHMFHKKCIKKWFRNMKRCPLCMSFQRKKYKVTHLNANSFIFMNRTIFFHNKHLIFGKKIINYQYINKMKLVKNVMCFYTIDKKFYVIASYRRNTTNEIYEQMKNKIESKLRRNHSHISIV